MKRPHHAGRTRSGGLSLNVFSAAEIDDIHVATLEVLEQHRGLRRSDEPLDILSDGGCRVDRETRIVRDAAARGRRRPRRLPAEHVPVLRSHARPRLHGRAGPRRLHQLRRGYHVIDPYTGEYRDPTTPTSPISPSHRRLSDIDGYESLRRGPRRPDETLALRDPARALKNTTKRWTGGSHKCDVASHRGHGAASPAAKTSCANGPLCLGVARSARSRLPATPPRSSSAPRAGLPDTILSMAMAGGSAPVTLAGTLVTTTRGTARDHAGTAHRTGLADHLRLVHHRHGPALCRRRRWARPSSP